MKAGKRDEEKQLFRAKKQTWGQFLESPGNFWARKATFSSSVPNSVRIKNM